MADRLSVHNFLRALLAKAALNEYRNLRAQRDNYLHPMVTDGGGAEAATFLQGVVRSDSLVRVTFDFGGVDTGARWCSCSSHSPQNGSRNLNNVYDLGISKQHLSRISS